MLDFFRSSKKTAFVRSIFLAESLNQTFESIGSGFCFVQEALSHVEANMTSGSLANLSHVSDVLTEHY